MNLETEIAILTGVVALIWYVLGILHLTQKMPLLSNAYMFATKEQRTNMDKRPYYIQGGVAYLLLGCIFSVVTLEAVLKTGWLRYIIVALAIVVILFAVISEIVILTKGKKEA